MVLPGKGVKKGDPRINPEKRTFYIFWHP